MKRHPYKDYYSWQTPLSEHVMGHNNGAVSCLIEWPGIDCDLADQGQKESAYRNIYQVLKELSVDGYIAEWHLWRELDRSLADAYLEQNQNIQRGHHLAVPARQAVADHLVKWGRSNETGIILYHHPQKSLSGSLFVKAARNDQIKDAKRIFEKAQSISRTLPGAAQVDTDRYLERVRQSYWRKGFYNNWPLNIDYRYDVAEQVLVDAPRVENGMVVIDGYHTKVLLLMNYSDAAPAWITALADASCDMHVVQVVSPVNTRRYIDRQTKESQDDAAALADRGVKYAKKKINERENFTSFVAENGLDIYKNVYLMHLHGKVEDINRLTKRLIEWASKTNGQIRADADLQAHFFRVGQPGHGAQSAFFREDHTWQVGNMAPVVTYDKGIPGAECLRLSASGQITGFSILRHKVSHGFTVAKTGSGKGMDKVCEIIETYPLGLDWYILEIGRSYRWVVEAFGKAYIEYDPDQDVINPLPEYDTIDSLAEHPVPAKLCAGTVHALAYLLTDGRTTLTVHQESAAEEALQNLYRSPIKDKAAPRLDHFYKSLIETEYNTQPKKEAAKLMADYLSSFLDSSVGRIFTQDGNLTLTNEMCGVSLEGALKVDPKLLVFCMTALSLRYAQMAFFSGYNPARVLLDEMHIGVQYAPETVGNLCAEVSRMGRRANASLDLVTQGLKEMQALDAEVIGSASLKTLMYRSLHHDTMGEVLQIPPGPFARWKSYPDPEKFNWRPALRQVGDKFYDLYLTFPQLILDIGSTSPEDLALKEQINPQVEDIFERIEMLRQMRMKN